MADGLFKSLYDGFRGDYHLHQRRKVFELIGPDLFDDPWDLIYKVIEHCCIIVINPHIKWKKARYHKPSYYRPLAKRIMKCIEEWDYEKEIERLEKDIRKKPAKEAKPSWKAGPLRDLADLYATCPEEKFRNGDKAVELACKACELTNYQNRDIVNVLAAAYAECDDFDKAIEYQKKAIKLVEDYQGDDDIERFWGSEDYEERLASYKQKKPWRQASEVFLGYF